jgi:radical SAM protein with 4Fe4S-binding SPASM domain
MNLSIELTNRCNANCQFCAHKYQKRKKAVISNKLFKFAIRQYVRSGGGIVILSPIVGDPLIDKNLLRKIRYVRKWDQIKYVSFYTNMIGLNDFNKTDLLLSGIDEINISACIGSRDMYRRVFGVDKYDSVIHNIEGLLQENRRIGDRIKIIIHVRGEKPSESIRASADYKHIINEYGRYIIHIEDHYDNWTGLIEKDNLPKNISFAKKREMSEPCLELYNGVYVFVSGDVGFCSCRDLEAQLKIGNIFEESLEDIWKGEKIKMIRKNWLLGNLPAICRECLRYRPLTTLLLFSGELFLLERIRGRRLFKSFSLPSYRTKFKS